VRRAGCAPHLIYSNTSLRGLGVLPEPEAILLSSFSIAHEYKGFLVQWESPWKYPDLEVNPEIITVNPNEPAFFFLAIGPFAL
jgi:hypothetical protein